MGAAQANPPVEKLLYSRKDVAYALSISLRSVDTMISNQVLVTRRFGGRVMIPAADVRRLAERIIRCDMLSGSSSSPKLKVVPKQDEPSRAAQAEPGRQQTARRA